ncbi:hypothetical protein ACFWWM_10010 [Streptomyces sp. NPDC058682]|uniref:hypothetical protein n=1 Tax=Streptomyces sp. NPDC058682 TaxID=3346596 RepID=UPI003668677D
MAEETGVHVPVGNLRQIGVCDQVGRDPRGTYVTFASIVIVPDGTPAIAGDDARIARWWPVKDLPERLAFDHADIICGRGTQLLRGRRLPGCRARPLQAVLGTPPFSASRPGPHQLTVPCLRARRRHEP